MAIYSFYVFDRHCTCVYFASFSPKPPRPGPTTLPNVFRPNLLPAATAAVPLPSSVRDSVATSNSSGGDRSSVGASWGRSPAEKEATKDEDESPTRGGLAFDEEAKLVYGIVFSLRNMVKKLSGRDEDSFQAFSTSAYKLHYLSTPTLTHFILVSSPTPESLRFALRQIHSGPYMDYVVRNPLIEPDSRISGKGIDSDAFRLGVEKIIAGL